MQIFEGNWGTFYVLDGYFQGRLFLGKFCTEIYGYFWKNWGRFLQKIKEYFWGKFLKETDE